MQRLFTRHYGGNCRADKQLPDDVHAVGVAMPFGLIEMRPDSDEVVKLYSDEPFSIELECSNVVRLVRRAGREFRSDRVERLEAADPRPDVVAHALDRLERIANGIARSGNSTQKAVQREALAGDIRELVEQIRRSV